MKTLIEEQTKDIDIVSDKDLWCKELPDNPNVSYCGEQLTDLEIPDREIPTEYRCPICAPFFQ